MTNRLKLLGITYSIGKIKFKLLFHGPLAELMNTYLGVSKNRGIPKWMVYNGKPY